MADLMWDMGNGGYLLIDEKVIETINTYATKEIDVESGGLLLGYFRGKHLHVVDLTTPKPEDRASKTRFHREDRWHIRFLNINYQRSAKKLNFLGEWHTHPERNPSPSYIDRMGWRKLEKNRKGLNTIFLIAGWEDIWVGTATGENLSPLNPDEPDYVS